MGQRRTRRQILKDKIDEHLKSIQRHQHLNQALIMQVVELNDEHSRYEQKPETFGRGKNKTTQLVGRLFWHEYYPDGDTGKQIKIERSRMVMLDGDWIFDNVPKHLYRK